MRFGFLQLAAVAILSNQRHSPVSRQTRTLLHNHQERNAMPMGFPKRLPVGNVQNCGMNSVLTIE